MAEKLACPKCGEPIYRTDQQCLSCGAQLDEGRDATLPAPAAAPATPATAPDPVSAPVAMPTRPLPGMDFSTQLPRRPSGITLMVIVCDCVALLGLTALFFILMAVSASHFFRSPLIMGLMGFLGVIYLGIIVIGHFVWNGYSWARYTFMALLVLQLMGSISQMAQAHRLGLVPGLVAVVSVLFLIILNDQDAKEFFVR